MTDTISSTTGSSTTGSSTTGRVDALLAAMTVDEKVAQLGSFWGQPGEGGEVAPMSNDFATSTLTFDDCIRDGLGQLTRTWGTTPLSLAEGVAAMRERQRRVVEASRFGIPAVAHEECLTGFTAHGATVYPTSLAWGSSFDPELVEQMARAIGEDMASVGVHQALSPVLDVVHDYRWGRVEETIGEDPYLVGLVGSAYVRGLESSGIVATLKHFAGYSASVAAVNHGPVRLGRRHLRDVVLVPFEMALRLGAARSVMNSYTDVDGVPCAADPWLLTDLLRGEWGFTGTVVSDYFAVNFLHEAHHVAATPSDAAVLALRAGLDVELPQTNSFAGVAGKVASGELPLEVLDLAVRRVLEQKEQLGLLDEGWQPRLDDPSSIDLDSPRNRELARRLAEESLVLVANDGTLPLAPGSRIAVVGPSASDPLTLMGCYSFPNHVLKHHPDLPLGIEVPSVLAALGEVFDVVGHEIGAPIQSTDTSGFAAAADLAAAAEVTVVTVGDIAGLFGHGTSGEGIDVPDLQLPGVQRELVERVLETGTKVVLVVVSGRPYALGGLAERCAAVVQAFFPGEEGAGAIARVLSGEVNPSGRLPVGIPATPGGQPWTYLVPPLGHGNNGATGLDPRPLFGFGHGLSYTSFELGDLRLSDEAIAPDGTLQVSVTVTNTGGVDGVHVVQLYLRDEVSQVTTPALRLVGFARVPLAAGASCRVTFDLHADRTAFTGLAMRRIVEPGWFIVQVGSSVTDLPLTGRFRIEGAVREVGHDRVLTTPWTLADPGALS
ncbi:glycoside hydrolase family 3 N-terminal domain-containing protein [Aestuariimicrobium soli]|uniref:glycoside hydrolase family 3 N-terminal domain-containing protein n=1 Tax=Aestuariimicrobium soli TaxID=2035834 RepID=UPI003EB8449D